jgi:short-subunit dehydrogenase
MGLPSAPVHCRRIIFEVGEGHKRLTDGEGAIQQRMTILRDKTILITGASSGLGRSLAVELAKRGNRIIATARREPLLLELRKEIESAGGKCLAIAGDSAVTSEAATVITRGIEAFGPIDIAVLNAGGGKGTNMATATAERVLEEMRMNYDTLVNYLCPLVAHMKVRGGTIAHTGSPAGFLGLPKSGPYSAAKAAGRMLLDSARIELARTPVKLVALYPGFTYTDGLDPDDVPIKALIIQKDRAVREMIFALERGRSSHMFPKRIAFLITLARLIPEPVRRWVLSRVA